MKWFLYAFSLISIAIGCCNILYTDETKKVIKSIVKGVDLRILSILPFVAGILFLLSASVCRFPWVIRFIGLMSLIEGALAFSNPNNLYDKILDWYLDSLSDQTHRFFGIVTLILGTAILTWIV
ncbi:MAG: hypothetical protein ABIK98_15135 [Pseudomonadota bacterium]